jgi:hypothetical protein
MTLGRLLTLTTGSSSRLLLIRFSADLTMYWFPVRHFRCMKIFPLVIWIWNQNIAISTIVETSSHINSLRYRFCYISELLTANIVDMLFLSETEIDDSFTDTQFELFFFCIQLINK